MKWRRLLFLASLGMLLVLAALVAVAVLVPIRFTVSVPGAVQPVRTWRVTAAESGLAVEIRAEGPVKKGDCLYRLDDGSDRRRLAEVEAQMGVLGERLDLERKAMANQEVAWGLEAEVLRAERAETAGILAQATGEEARMMAAEIAARSLAQNVVDAELAASEYAILRKLAADLSVPAMEMAQGEARAKKAALQVERAKLEEQRRVLGEEHDIARLRMQLGKHDAREKQILGHQQDARALAEVAYRIAQLQAECAELEGVIRRKTCAADCDGDWGGLPFVPGEYVAQGALVGVLRSTAGLLFVGEAKSMDYAWLTDGAVARLRLQAYPFLKYGSLPATITGLEATADGEQPRFVVKLALDDAKGNYLPTVGLAGVAHVVVFRGSLVNYLMAEPPSVREPRFKPLGAKNRLSEWLKSLER